MLFPAKSSLFAFIIIRFLCEASVNFDTDFDNVNEFVAKVEEVSETFQDFVIKIEAIFCPERFNCNLEEFEVVSREDILRRLPKTVLIRNETVKLEDMKDLVGVCCFPCSCSEMCYKIGNCCPTKAINANNTALDNNRSTVSDNNKSVGRHAGYTQKTNNVLTECIAATVKSYQKKDIKRNYNSFYMITKCLLPYSNNTVVESCGSPFAFTKHDIVPVTSNKTGFTYWNLHCAECNNDSDTAAPWQGHVEYDLEMIYFGNMSGFTYPSTVEEFYTNTAFSRLGDIRYTPPIPLENQMCLRTCEEMPLNRPYQAHNTNGSNFLMEACHIFDNPVFAVGFRYRIYPYRNIYCYLSQQIRLTDHTEEKELECSYEDLFKFAPPQITALLDFDDTSKTQLNSFDSERTTLSQEKCSCGQIFDTFSGVCRQLYCPSGEYLIDCSCHQPLKNLSGMPILLTLKVQTKNGINVHMTRSKLNGYHDAIHEAIHETSAHTLAEICATYRKDSDEGRFVSLALVHSKHGWDTKQAMEPFMKYLDTKHYMRIGPLEETYDVTLSSRVMVHYGFNADIGEKEFTVSDLEFKDQAFTMIYSNTTAFTRLRHLVGVRKYQVLSPLLYCRQIQFEVPEFFLDDGHVIINSTSHNVSVQHYYMMDPNHVRICANDYIHKSVNLSSKPSNPLCMYFVEFICIQFFVSVWKQSCII